MAILKTFIIDHRSTFGQVIHYFITNEDALHLFDVQICIEDFVQFHQTETF
jgi:hypothetical protein